MQHKPSRVLKSLSKMHFTWWILIFNAASSAFFIGLYLTNYLIPASIDASPDGHFWIFLIKLTIVLKAFSTAYAISLIISRFTPVHVKEFIVNQSVSLLLSLKDWRTIRIALQRMQLVALIVKKQTSKKS